MPLALFSKMQSPQQKNELVASLKAANSTSERFKKRSGAGYGRPCFPSDVSSSTNLSDLVGSDS